MQVMLLEVFTNLNLEFSDIAIFSLTCKIISTREGGIATTNNENLYRKMNYFVVMG